ncbi:MAG: MarR family winged helix-turn-helix transcriptional regulator [Ktedonobacteraceae bacterium]
MSHESNFSENNAIDIANRLHSVAIHLLRRVRQEDPLTGLSPARLSALSVIGFGGPRTISELAEAEQVAVPTISRVVAALVAEELVERQADERDRRTIYLTITPKGMQILREGQRRRTTQLGHLLAQLTPAEQETIAQALSSMERVLHGPGGE